MGTFKKSIFLNRFQFPCLLGLLLAVTECQILLAFEDHGIAEGDWSGILEEAPLLEFVQCFSHDETSTVNFEEKDH